VPARDVTLSIVSHGQNALINPLLADLSRFCADRIVLVLTENIPDPTPLALDGLPCPVERIANTRVKGFGANHNAAFAHCRTTYYGVVNPDIRLAADPLPALVAALAGGAGVAGPLVRSPAGNVEDSARRFPTFASLVRRVLREERRPDYPPDRGTQAVDWVAGMFMLFPAEAYRAAGGFDEAYFMYYEDVDLCRRLKRMGKPAAYVPAAEVVHAAQRASRRRPALAWQHLKSALRFLARG
jgi:GT2 family glycosyltransferase